jgi:hypothetical protein
MGDPVVEGREADSSASLRNDKQKRLRNDKQKMQWNGKQKMQWNDKQKMQWNDKQKMQWNDKQKMRGMTNKADYSNSGTASKVHTCQSQNGGRVLFMLRTRWKSISVFQ